MNTSTNPRPVSIALALTVVASIVTIFGTTGTASAGIASEPRGGRASSVSTATSDSYGKPLAALDGQSLALYVSAHWAPVIVAGV